MHLHPGARIWIPCEVKPGTFSHERMVRVETSAGEWLGFVDAGLIKDRDLTEGATFVLATVEQVVGERFSARLPGHAIRSMLFEGNTEKAVRVGSLEA